MGLFLAACARPGLPTPNRQERPVVFEGMCDASGAIALSDRLLVVASDEDNVLRTYDVTRGGPPVSSTDVSPALGLRLKGKRRPRAPEADLEAAARIGNRAYWMTSHARSSKGRPQPERLLFFSTTASTSAIELVGRPYEHLLDDMLAEPALATFRLAEAAMLPPKAQGGLNIEGLTATPSGELLIAFRNPVPDGRALLVPLRNPAEVVAGQNGMRARLGTPILLDLGGDGVRSLSWWRGRYFIIAGHYGSGGRSRVYEWSGQGPPALVSIDLGDGDREIDGAACKDLDDPTRKAFRGRWFRPPSSTTTRIASGELPR
jgi:hypothetical protein